MEFHGRVAGAAESPLSVAHAVLLSAFYFRPRFHARATRPYAVYERLCVRRDGALHMVSLL